MFLKHLLIIEDDASFGLMLKTFLEKQSYAVQLVTNAASGLKALSNHKFNLIISDLRLPDLYGLDFLVRAKGLSPGLPVIMMTGYADIKSAVDAIKLGAADYVTKPIKPDELLAMVEAIFSKGRDKPKKTGYIAGKSEASQVLERHINLVAPTDISVIIEGESGTGKEYVAKAIHDRSARCNNAFVAVDCGALPKELSGSELFGHVKGAFTGAHDRKKGHFETANEGTLFLDEIGNLSYDHQILLLRAMQEKSIRPLGSNQIVEVDVRLIAATNDSLVKMVEAGKFREDLYFRLNEFSFTLPAVRERPEDIPVFIQHFLDEANLSLHKSVSKFDSEAMRTLVNYMWPGNFRELRNVIKRAVLLSQGNVIQKSHLPSEVLYNPSGHPKSQKVGLKSATAEIERELIVKALENAKFNKAKAARALRIDRKTLYAKIVQLNIIA
ncbi:MAG: sigma-54 dependent transcriptional regulator [Bacteroidota bacterium]